MNIIHQWYVVSALLRRDIKVFLKTFFDNIIDSSIIITCTYAVYGYLLPQMGMSSALLGPIFMGVIILVAINILYDRALRDMVDLTFTHYIDYQIMLPLRLRWLLCKYIISYSIDFLLSVIPLFLLGLVLYNPFMDSAYYRFDQFFISLLLVGLVIATGFLLEIFFVSFEWFRENTFARILSPMILLGSVYFPFMPVYKAFPWIGKLLLLSPVTYMAECLRATLLDPQDYMPLWISRTVLMSLLFLQTILLLYYAHKRVGAVS